MLESGDIITLSGGAWRLHAPLAASSYGLLWQAAPLAGGAPAVVKLVNRDQMALATPAHRARWIDAAANEIAFLSALQPWDRRHTVRLLDSGAHDGLPACALERLDTDLARHLAALRARGMHVGLAQSLDWLAQVNQALGKVHGYGWRYLDLKPSNLLLDRRDLSLKLADFGTIRPLTDRAPHPYAGTANWQAPEQFFALPDGGHLTDARSDYFALGALLYFLVTGVLLRYCAACGDAFRAHGTAGSRLAGEHGGRPASVLGADEAGLFARAAHADDAGAGALALLRALLQPDPERRPRHALEISRLIERARAGASGRAGLRSAA